MRIHCVSSGSKDSLSVVVFCYILMCWLLWFSCQYLPSGWLERPLWGHLNVVRRLPPQSPGGRECLCVFFFCLVSMFLYVFPRPYTIYIFHTPMTRYSLFVLKVSLNTTKQTNKHIHPAETPPSVEYCRCFVQLTYKCCIVRPHSRNYTDRENWFAMFYLHWFESNVETDVWVQFRPFYWIKTACSHLLSSNFG